MTRRPDNTYVPLDEILRVPAVQLLRVLKRWDWAGTEDIRFALGLADIGWRGYEPYTQALCRLHRDDCVERRGPVNDGSYRITELGRARLRRYMARAELAPMTAREESLDRTAP